MFQLSKDNIENGSIEVSLTQSNIDTANPKEVKVIKTTTCSFHEGIKEDDIVEAIYEIDKNQLVQCNIKHVDSGEILAKMEHRID